MDERVGRESKLLDSYGTRYSQHSYNSGGGSSLHPSRENCPTVARPSGSLLDNVQSETDAFVHSPLNRPESQLRLISFENPANSDGKLKCNLQTFDREAAPRYNAFSYTWGPPHPQRVIQVKQRPLPARHNCWYALKQARALEASPHSGGLIPVEDESSLITNPEPVVVDHYWIDSICINQNGLEEKSAQVRMMGSVYRGAQSVFVSLGARADDSEFLFMKMEELVDFTACGEH